MRVDHENREKALNENTAQRSEDDHSTSLVIIESSRNAGKQLSETAVKDPTPQVINRTRVIMGSKGWF